MARQSPKCQSNWAPLFPTAAAMAGITTSPQLRESPETAKPPGWGGSILCGARRGGRNSQEYRNQFAHGRSSHQ
jgi:hypothetical protein